VRLRQSALALLVATGVSCAPRPALPGREPAVRELTAHVALHGAMLTLHLADPRTGGPSALPLVLYASGDGGWFGAAVAMFRTITAGGYPAVGFSARSLLKIEQAGHAPLSGNQIAESYRAILETSRRALALPPDAPAVLTGWSRGASLAVLAAAEPETDRGITGVVAIGLPQYEQLDVEPGDDGDPPKPAEAIAPSRGHSLARDLLMYPLLARIAPRRCAVVQASGDRYLPAVQARALFGDDTGLRRFFAVEADNHRFGGGKAALRQAMLDALAWTGQRAGEAYR
jgi:hypothetical protein